MTLDPLSVVIGIIIGSAISSLIWSRQMKGIIRDNTAAMSRIADTLTIVRNLNRSLDSLGREVNTLEITMRALAPRLTEMNSRPQARRNLDALDEVRKK